MRKDTCIIPLFKCGSRNDARNDRDISELSAIPKNHYRLLRMFWNLVNDAFKGRKQTNVIYTDFSNAFDEVNHTLLLVKLNLCGFSNLLLKWFSSYLTVATQDVKFEAYAALSEW
ncbi:uncharacterized protein LOC131998405, partial [Stomoxys calcitrans]|uniref:uncharacterized protein LOC131998405 n=1 Tax=Stomoxys calcitrans TaxID=35570 RepID=UPI0027E21A6D